MASGIRATVKFDSPGECPLARFSETADTTINHVSSSVALPNSTGSVTEFFVAVDDLPDDGDREPVFSYGSSNLYRIAHDGDVCCPCECLGQFGCPVHRYTAAEGALTLVFHAEDFRQLQDVMAEFRERYTSVDVQQLLQPPLEGTPEERVFVNRGKLTDRQLEVLQAAYEKGYFERPKRANATEIASELGISQSTFTEHLVAAQSKIFEDVL
ncbi:helix-turn-helix domain-containing protein (plasmid) [Haladaptatus sp. SPP-AMP-3]|uniref:helix-turn-helix domain-containing protein n=1 Tax=Haladaptatus sp. SPP-AMP-3 TaxID=3121295 RepID=UPI003C2D0C6C